MPVDAMSSHIVFVFRMSTAIGWAYLAQLGLGDALLVVRFPRKIVESEPIGAKKAPSARPCGNRSKIRFSWA